MPKSWKQYERTMCETLSLILFGVSKPKGGRIDKDCPLCRAADSGSHPSDIRPGDVVPSGLWIRDGRLIITPRYNWVIELKYIKGLRFDLLFKRSEPGFFKHWKQAVRQADSYGKTAVPILIVNKEYSSHNYVVTDYVKFSRFGVGTLPRQKLIFYDDNVSLVIFTLKAFQEVNTTPPFASMIRGKND